MKKRDINKTSINQQNKKIHKIKTFSNNKKSRMNNAQNHNNNNHKNHNNNSHNHNQNYRQICKQKKKQNLTLNKLKLIELKKKGQPKYTNKKDC